MNLVDSSGWMEYFTDGPQAASFSKPIEDHRHLVVPTICLYEVFKKALLLFDERKALELVAVMRTGEVKVFDDQMAFASAVLSHQLKLPMADSIILATARHFRAIIWTQDSHFEGLSDVKYFPKK